MTAMIGNPVLAEPSRRAGGGWIAAFACAWLGIWMAQLTPIQLLLPTQVNLATKYAGNSADWVSSVVAFGVISSIAGVCAIIAYPLTGSLSDRTTSPVRPQTAVDRRRHRRLRRRTDHSRHADHNDRNRRVLVGCTDRLLHSYRSTHCHDLRSSSNWTARTRLRMDFSSPSGRADCGIASRDNPLPQPACWIRTDCGAPSRSGRPFSAEKS